MASRVRTRISFGAFANLKNNQQQQIGLNNLITSIKKIVSTFNNNFSYIINSFNVFMQFKYDIHKYGMFVNKEKNDTYLDFNNVETNYEKILDRIKIIKKRLDVLEQGDFNSTYVDAEVMWTIKEYNFYNGKNVGHIQILTPSGKTQYSIAKGNIKYKLLFWEKDSQGYVITNSMTNSATGQPYRYYTDKVKILAGYTKDIDFGPFYASTTHGVLGPITFTLTFSGLLNGKFPKSYNKLDSYE